MRNHPIRRLGAGCLILALGLSPGPSASAASFTRGDVDQSGDLSLTDAVGLIHSLFLGAGEPACLDAADADDTGFLELTDAIYLLNFLFFAGSAPPAPYPDCGADPTPDPVGCIRFESPAACGTPEDCGNVVARTAERGCGRVFVWGDEHVMSDNYWPVTEPFWVNALFWLSEPSCGNPIRSRISFHHSRPFPGLLGAVESNGFVLADGGLESTDILITRSTFGPQDGKDVADWVERGGALMTLTVGFSGGHQDHCEAANSAIRPLGLEYACLHEAPWGPVSVFEDHPISSGLAAENAPFVNGAFVLESPGSEGSSQVMARVGDNCSPREVPDCRFPIAFNGPPPRDTLVVESDCGAFVSGGVNFPSGARELNVIGIYEAPAGEVTVRVNRAERMVLVLSSYDPVLWIVETGFNAVVEKVILNGYYPQEAVVPFDVELESFDYEVNHNYLGTGYGDDCGGGQTLRLVTNVEAHTGLTLRSFHGCYRAASFTLGQ